MMLIDLLSMTAGTIFVTMSAALLWKRTRPCPGSSSLATACFTWILTTIAFTMLMGIAGQLNAPRIGAFSVVGSALLFFFFRNQYTRVGRTIITLLRRTPSFDPVNLSVLILALLLLGRTAFHLWFVPPYDDDVLIYHLPNVAEWVQNSRIHPVTASSAMTFFPMSYAVLETFFALFLHSDTLIGLAGTAFLLLGVCSVHDLARFCGVAPKYARLAAVLFAFTPVFAVRTTTGDAELPVAALYLFSSSLILRLFSTYLPTRESKLRIFFWFVMSFIVGMGVKPTFAMLAPGFLVPVGWWGVFHRNRNDLRKHVHKLRHVIGVLNPAFVVLLCAASLSGSYWYARNWVVSGNPVYPARVQIGGTDVFDNWVPPEDGGLIQNAKPGPGLLVLNLKKAGIRTIDSKGVFDTTVPHRSGWGWFAFCLGFPSFFIALVFFEKFRVTALMFFISLCTLLATVAPDPWFMRFTAWFPALFALCFVLVVTILPHGKVRAGLMILAIATTILNHIGMFPGGNWTPQDFRRMIQTPVLKRSTTKLMEYREPEYAAALAHIRPDESFAYSMPQIDYVYPLYGNRFSRKPFYVDLNKDDPLPKMRTRGARYLFVTRAFGRGKAFLEQAVAEGTLVQVSDFLYRLSDGIQQKDPYHE